MTNTWFIIKRYWSNCINLRTSTLYCVSQDRGDIFHLKFDTVKWASTLPSISMKANKFSRMLQYSWTILSFLVWESKTFWNSSATNFDETNRNSNIIHDSWQMIFTWNVLAKIWYSFCYYMILSQSTPKILHNSILAFLGLNWSIGMMV